MPAGASTRSLYCNNPPLIVLYMKKDDLAFSGSLASKTPEIYLNVDHLKDGSYIIHVTLRDKIIRTIKFEKKP